MWRQRGIGSCEKDTTDRTSNAQNEMAEERESSLLFSALSSVFSLAPRMDVEGCMKNQGQWMRIPVSAVVATSPRPYSRRDSD